jgi:hypothetical protein
MFRERTMKAAWRWLLATVVCLTVGQGLAPAKSAKPPRATALVGYPSGGGLLDAVMIVGGYAARRGWVGSEEASGLVRSGDRMRVYALHAGRVGEVVVTDSGTVFSTVGGHPQYRGLEYATRRQATPGEDHAAGGESLISVWHAPRSPEPRWAQATALDGATQIYRDIIARWVRQHGRGDRAQAVQVRQILRADVNHDGRDDLLLSFDWVDRRLLPRAEDKTAQAYLLLRYLPRGSRTPRTIVVTDRRSETLEVIGLCDLDRDGWAEVVVEDAGHEWGGTWLYHWSGSGFASVMGDQMGV